MPRAKLQKPVRAQALQAQPPKRLKQRRRKLARGRKQHQAKTRGGTQNPTQNSRRHKMKLTLSQRLKILFTGKLPETQLTIENAELNTSVRETLTAYHRASHEKVATSEYARIARLCRVNEETWWDAKTCNSPETAVRTKGNITRGAIQAFHKPRGGHWEARIIEQQGKYTVQVRFINNQQELKIK